LRFIGGSFTFHLLLLPTTQQEQQQKKEKNTKQAQLKQIEKYTTVKWKDKENDQHFIVLFKEPNCDAGSVVKFQNDNYEYLVLFSHIVHQSSSNTFTHDVIAANMDSILDEDDESIYTVKMAFR